MKPSTIFLTVLFTFAATSAARSQEKSKVAKFEIESFNLDHARAPEVVKILNEQFLDAVTFSANSSTNVIYGRVPEEVLPEVKRFIAELEDVAAKREDDQRTKQREEDMEREQRAKASDQAMQQAKSKHRFESFPLNHVTSLEAFNTIKDLGFDGKIAITMEPRGNSLMVRGDDESLEALGNVIKTLDVPPEIQAAGDAGSKDLEAASQELFNLEAQLQQLLLQYGPNHPKVLLLRQRMEANKEFFDLTKRLDLAHNRPTRQEPLAISGYEIAERKAATLAEQWRKENATKEPDAAKLGQLETEVKEQVRLAFELRQRLKKMDLERAAAQMETIRKRLGQREKLAYQIIQRRVQDLIRGDDLTWLSPRAAAANPDEKVVIEALDTGVIMLRGSKANVEKVKKTIQNVNQIQSKNVPRVGDIVQVNDDEKMAVLSIGTDDGLKVGNVVSVARDGVTIGQLRVVSVAPDHASASIESAKDGAAIGPGDEIKVMTKGGDRVPLDSKPKAR